MMVQASYDTNIAAFATTRLSQASYIMAPHIGFSQYRPKLALNLSYDGGLGIYQQLADTQYLFPDRLRATFSIRFASRWQGHANDRYTYSADPFGSYFTIVGQPTPNNPNPNVYVPFATTEQNMGELDLSDQLSKYDTLTFTGNAIVRRYSNYASNINFQDGTATT